MSYYDDKITAYTARLNSVREQLQELEAEQTALECMLLSAEISKRKFKKDADYIIQYTTGDVKARYMGVEWSHYGGWAIFRPYSERTGRLLKRTISIGYKQVSAVKPVD